MHKKMNSIVSDLIFYGMLVCVLVTALAVSGKNSKGPRVIGGYSAFVVLTGSMEDVIPKGSLVVTKSVDPQTLTIGDDITYMVSERTTVTHRIIGIEEKYLDTGERAFRTKGTMNTEADRNPVAAVNVVGKVIYHNKTLGEAVSFGQDNWPLVIFFIVIFLAFIKIVEIILRKEEPEQKKEQTVVKEKTKEEQEDDGFVLEIIDL